MSEAPPQPREWRGPGPFSCTLDRRDRGEPAAGSAPEVSSFLLMEESGPWGTKAWRDARLPAGVGAQVLARCEAAGVRPWLIRRHVAGGESEAREGQGSSRTVFAVRAGLAGGQVERRQIDDPEHILDVDFAALGAGRSLGWDAHEDPIFAICTHGKKDLCCARFGRPVLAEFARLAPADTWAVSHVGGHRFAANAVVLGEGVYYGDVEPGDVAAIIAASARHEVVPGLMRGRTTFDQCVQSAEIAVRLKTGERGSTAVRLASRSVAAGRAEVHLIVAGRLWRVCLALVEHEPGRLSCADRDEESITAWRVTELRAE